MIKPPIAPRIMEIPPFPAAESIPFVTVGDGGELQITPEAASFLSTITKPLGVLSIAGKYRTGKSTLICRLLGQKNAMNIGHTVNACTKGLVLYGSVLHMEEMCVLVIDSEGLLALDSDATHDARVFALSVLLSSSFVYNVSSTLDEATLSTLRVVVEFASMMTAQLSNNNNNNNNTKSIDNNLNLTVTDNNETNNNNNNNNMPSLAIIVRDFALRLETTEGAPMTPTEWLENALQTDGIDERLSNVDDKVEIRRAVKDVFRDRTCYTLPRPSLDESILGQMDTIDDAKLNPGFVDCMHRLRADLIGKCPVKTLFGEPVTGVGLLTMAENIVNAINSGHAPIIRDSWALVAELNARNVADEAEAHFDKMTSDWACAKVPPKKLENGLAKVVHESVNILKDRLNVGFESIHQRLVDSLNMKSDRLKDAHAKFYSERAVCTLHDIRRNLENHQKSQQECQELFHQMAEKGVDEQCQWLVKHIETMITDGTNALIRSVGTSDDRYTNDLNNCPVPGVYEGWTNFIYSSIFNDAILAAVRSTIACFSGQLDHARVKELEEKHENHCSRLNGRIGDLELERDDVLAQVESLQTQIREHVVKIDDLETKINVAQQYTTVNSEALVEVEALRVQLDASKVAQKSAEREIRELKSAISVIETDSQQALERVSVHTERAVSDMKADMCARLDAAVADAATAKSLEKEARSAQMLAENKVECLTSELGRLRADLQSLRQQHDIAIQRLSDEKSQLLSDAAKLKTFVECGKRELDQVSKREDDYAQNVKKLKIDLESVRISQARAEAARGAVLEQLHTAQGCVEDERDKNARLQIQRCEVERNLAVANCMLVTLGGERL